MKACISLVVVIASGCGPSLADLSQRQIADLYVEVNGDRVWLRVHPLDGTTAESCPALGGATATRDGVVMSESPNEGGWHPRGSFLPLPGPSYYSSPCDEFSWFLPFSTSSNAHGQSLFVVRDGSVAWTIEVRNFGLERPVTGPLVGNRGRSVFFERAESPDGAGIAGSAASFTHSDTQLTTQDRVTWNVNLLRERDGGFLVPVPVDAELSQGFLHLSSLIKAEVDRCDGPANCSGTYTTRQIVAFETRR